MKKKKIKILCTLGPSSLNKKFLSFAKGKVNLLRLNMSHIEINNLKKIIFFLKKNSKIPICIDTEGAQIRTKVNKTILYKKNQKFKIYLNKGNFNIYPREILKKIKTKDILDIGFSGLVAQVIKVKKDYLSLQTTSQGLLENNKGVHLKNRTIKLNFLTQKDFKAIKIAKKLKIKNFALSFTNSVDDMKKFKNILASENKIYKIETRKAIKNINSIVKNGEQFLIDRGDLSKETSLEEIPLIQRNIFNVSKKYKNKKVFVATNLLESMMYNNYPTRGEANDIFSSLEMGASGLVLAAESAIGKFPIEAINFLNKIIKSFLKNK